MRILGIETSTKFLCLGILDADKICEYNLDLGRRHSESLVPTVERLLDALGWDIKDIDYFACGQGPGSFTGIRIGMSSVKAWAWSLNKPVVGICTLDIIAASCEDNEAYIVPAVDAKRGLIYCAVFKRISAKLKRIGPYLLLGVEDFLRKVPKNSVIMGDALGLYKEKILRRIKGVSILESNYWYPRAGCLIRLAQEKIRKRQLTDAFRIKPIYLYPKECQIRKK